MHTTCTPGSEDTGVGVGVGVGAGVVVVSLPKTNSGGKIQITGRKYWMYFHHYVLYPINCRTNNVFCDQYINIIEMYFQIQNKYMGIG